MPTLLLLIFSSGQDAHSTHSPLPITYYLLPITHSRFPIPDSRFPIPHN
ncbi:hypothetical protein [Moorena producens]